MNQLNEGYKVYKKNDPDFAKVVEKEEGKVNLRELWPIKKQYWKNHCKGCGEWPQGFDMYPECGCINE